MSSAKDSSDKKQNHASRPVAKSPSKIVYNSPPKCNNGGDNVSLNIEDELARLELETFDDFVSSLGDFGNPESTTSSDKCFIPEPAPVLKEKEISKSKTSVLKSKRPITDHVLEIESITKHTGEKRAKRLLLLLLNWFR